MIKYLPQEFGGISKSGKVSDFVVDPLDQTRSLTDQQKKFGEIYERVFKFIDNMFHCWYTAIMTKFQTEILEI